MITHTWLDSARLARLARRGRYVALALAAVGVAAAPATAAVVTVTDCVNDAHIVVQNGTDTTRIEVGADDLVIACPLEPLGGTDGIVLAGANVTIQGPAGRVAADGSGTSVRITASATFSAIDTVLEATDGNGAMDIIAVGNILFEGTTVTVGATGAGGDLLLITCTGAAPDCTITASASSFKSREVDIIAVGDIILGGVTITTNSPRDRVEIISLHGNVDAGTGTTAQGQQGPVNKCLGGTDPISTPNVILGGPESDLLIQAFGFVDLSGSRITVAQNIDVMSGVGGGAASVPAFIDLTGAAIRNDVGKRGEIVMVADETVETITIEDVLLIDDDESAGVNDVSELNGCEVVPRAGCPNVVGTPSVDS
jgi:hypothetical protein